MHERYTTTKIIPNLRACAGSKTGPGNDPSGEQGELTTTRVPNFLDLYCTLYTMVF